MDSLQIGELTVAATANGFSFTCHGDTAQAVIVPRQQMDTLRAFLAGDLSDERRLGFRVPLRPLPNDIRTSFDVSVTVDGTTTHAHAVDLSLTGVLLEVLDVQLTPGAHLTAKLCLGDDCVLLGANVVRQDGKLTALHFPACISEGELDPPESLLNIYRALELEWLKSRVHS